VHVENGVHTLGPSHSDFVVTRRLDGDNLIWIRPDFAARMERIVTTSRSVVDRSVVSGSVRFACGCCATGCSVPADAPSER